MLSELLRLPLRLVPRGLTVPILTGPLRGWKWVTGSSTHGCWLGTYEREAQDVFVRLVHKGDVVYDIGANVGFFALLAAKLGGAVHAFEPLPSNLGYLRRHVAANRAAVQIFDLALASASGLTRFASASSPSMAHLDDKGDIEVRTETIDGLVAAGRIPPPRFVKMDVEGAEYDVLCGAKETLTRHRPSILLSTHGYAMHQRCCDLLKSLSYEIEMIRDGTIDGQYTLLATVKAPAP